MSDTVGEEEVVETNREANGHSRTVGKSAGPGGVIRPRRRPKEISVTTLEETRQGVEQCLQVVKSKLARYEWWGHRLVGVNILFSALATLIVGFVGVVGDRAAASVPGGWRVACILAAVFSLLVTLSGAYAGAYRVPETVARCKSCLLDLENLKLDFNDKNPAAVVAHFKKLRKTYNDILAGAN